MESFILVPEFNRLSDWAGLWSMEPLAFHLLKARLQNIDLTAHVAQEPPQIVSALEKFPARGGQSIAVIRIAGTLMKSQSSMGGTSSVQLRRDIRQAASDPEVSSILLAFDSPGGTVAGTDDLASEVRAARKQKTVIGHVDDLCASAAYMVASQCEAIYANSPTAMVGSIGTIMTVYDLSDAVAKEGIKAFCFATGPLKGAGTEGTKITEEQAAYFQAIIDDTQQTFDSAVRKGRGLTDKQLSDVRTGAIFLAENALTKKLIDGIRPIGKTLEEMTKASSNKSAGTNHGSLPMILNSFPMAKANLFPGRTL